jgi:paraquat-inducible protein B
VEIKGKASRNEQELRNRLNSMIERGLRAQLGLQSLVTGQLMVELDFFPDIPVRLTGFKSDYPEIPTIPSSMEQLAQKLKQLPIDKIADSLAEILANIEKATGGSKINNIVTNVDIASKNLNSLILGLDSRLKKLLDNLVDTSSKNLNSLILDVDSRSKKLLDSLVVASSDAQELLGDARRIVKDVDGQIQPLSDKAQDALVSAKKAMDEAKTAMEGVNKFVGDHSDTRLKLNRSLDEISAAARSLNSLMDYLERHPEALLKGKSDKGGQ